MLLRVDSAHAMRAWFENQFASDDLRRNRFGPADAVRPWATRRRQARRPDAVANNRVATREHRPATSSAARWRNLRTVSEVREARAIRRRKMRHTVPRVREPGRRATIHPKQCDASLT